MSVPLSVVVTSRNDDHGGNALRRTRIFFRGLLEQSTRHSLPIELIVVDWNPPADRPPLSEVLKPPAAAGPWTVRFITVPRERHRQFAHSDGLPLFQMIAKNVGIRRAHGRFVLATNIDILFSDELMRFLKDGLVPGRMYRVDRTDVRSEVPEDVGIAAQLAWCRANVLRWNRRGVTVPVDERPPTLRRRLGMFLRSIPEAGRAFQLLRDRTELHTNGCGDFTLMSRADWFLARAYLELAAYSLRMDSLLCYQAHFAGIREAELKAPRSIFHIEHAAGSGWTPGAGAALLNQRLKSAGIPQVEREQYSSWIKRMRVAGRPMYFHGADDWGLPNEQLPEVVVSG